MSHKTPNHFSNNLELEYNKKSSFITDKIKLSYLSAGIVFGILLMLLGVYDMLNMFENGFTALNISADISKYNPIFEAEFFDICFIVVGLGIAVFNILSCLKYNKYKFNNAKVTIIKRPLWGKKVIKEEKLSDYSGVRFRVELIKKGIITKNRFIIELYNSKNNNIIPLYISTSPRDIRKKWKDYAKQFNKPALINTETGLKSFEIKDFGKSIKSLYKAGKIVDDYDNYDELPSRITFVRKKDKMVLKIKKVVWDIYNILAWVSIILIGLLDIITLINFNEIKANVGSYLYWFLAVSFVIIAVSLEILFRKEKIIIKKQKIVNTHKYMLFSTKHNEIMKKDIEDVEITENPSTGRFFVALISDDNTIAFGSKLKIKDLLWIKKFLIHEIIE